MNLAMHSVPTFNTCLFPICGASVSDYNISKLVIVVYVMNLDVIKHLTVINSHLIKESSWQSHIMYIVSESVSKATFNRDTLAWMTCLTGN